MMNALIRQYNANHVGVVGQVFVDDFKNIPENWQIRYLSRPVNRKSLNVRDFCCNSLNPLQIYKPEQDAFPITVASLEGDTLQVNISPIDNVDVLKIKIYQRWGRFPPDVQELHTYLQGSDCTMELGQNLKKLGLSSGSTVYMKVNYDDLAKLRMDVNFAPIDIQSTSTGLNGLRSKHAGMQFYGICENSECASKKPPNIEKVSNYRGYGFYRYDFKKTGYDHPLLCRKFCLKNEKKMSFLVPGFVACMNSVSVVLGRKFGDDNVIDWTGQLRQSPPNFTLNIDAEKPEILEIISVEPWRSPYYCLSCDVSIAYMKEVCRLKCGHIYHTWCKPIIDGMERCIACTAEFLNLNFQISSPSLFEAVVPCSEN